jgi:hypothetical protein
MGKKRNDVTAFASSVLPRESERCVQNWEIDQMHEEEDGLVFFDGGTFSRGPHCLLDAPPPPANDDDYDTVPQDAAQVCHLQLIHHPKG